MKNKKLFAILTLVCFMFTLMPVAAFAADADVVIEPSATTLAAGSNTIDVTFSVTPDVTTRTAYLYTHNSPAVEIAGINPVTVPANDNSVTVNVPVGVLSAGDQIGVVVTNGTAPTTASKNAVSNQSGRVVTANMINLAQDSTVDPDASYVSTIDKNATAKVDKNVEITFTFNNRSGNNVNAVNVPIFIWAVESGSNVASSSLKGIANSSGSSIVIPAGTQTFNTSGSPVSVNNVIAYNADNGEELNLQFARAGEYTIYAALQSGVTSGTTQANYVANMTQKLSQISDSKVIKVTADTTASSDYELEVVNEATLISDGIYTDNVKKGPNGFYEDGQIVGTLQLAASSVEEATMRMKLYDGNGKALSGKTVKITSSSSAVTVSKESVTTNSLGQFEVELGATIEGKYKVFVTCGNFEVVVDVQVGATSAAYINTIKAPTAPIDLGIENFSDYIRFNLTDINGNLVVVDDAVQTGGGADKAGHSDDNNYNFNGTMVDATNYVSIVSQPSASTLENSDLKLVVRENNANNYASRKYQATIESDSPFVAEGTYTLKVALDNGNFTTVTFEVKEFTTPVSINLLYAAPAVELGGTVNIDTLEYVDANGVTKSARGKVDLAATGYAISTFNTNTGAVTVKSDEKYVGQTVTVTAVDSRYNLTATATLTVADEATALAFSTNKAEVNINNKVTVTLVDGSGNRVALNGSYAIQSADVSYVVLEKPEGAIVSATTAAADNNLATAGSFKMSLTSNKIGNVKIQAIAKIVSAPNTDSAETQQTKYYTGTQTFAVGTGATGKTVVMSVGSNQVVVDNQVETMDAQPVVQNNRTFVPFRALSEAFGAKVSYDEATQAVTAELNGVTVVMTVGSPTYTINGIEKTMDVAPYISGSRTMVPVRFMAEAMGITVTPTYDENGATADILFTM